MYKRLLEKSISINEKHNIYCVLSVDTETWGLPIAIRFDKSLFSGNILCFHFWFYFHK